MSIFKSNSSLIAFSQDFLSHPLDFLYLSFIQNFDFELSSNRINTKYLGNENLIKNQFVKPDLNLNIKYFQRVDFLNEKLFGFNITPDYKENKSAFYNIINDFNNKNAFILYSDIISENLITNIKNNGYSNSLISMSMLNLYLSAYSFSYKINEHPTVLASFLSQDLNISKLSYGNINLCNDTTSLNSTIINKLINSNNSDITKTLSYTLKNFYFVNSFSDSSVPGIDISSLFNGLIQSLDFSFQLEREKMYFFENTNSVSSRNLKLPIKGSLKINGISNNVNLGNLNNLFTLDNKFNITISIGKSITNNAIGEMKFENLTIEKFNYSLDINSMLMYSLECSFQVTSTSGLKIKVDPFSINNDQFDYVVTSNNDVIYTLDNDLVVSSII